jgi:hypothetical protein
MQTVTFRAQGLRVNFQRCFCACLMAALLAGFCTHNAKAAFEDDSASSGSGSEWTGTDGDVSSDSGQHVDLNINCHSDSGALLDDSLVADNGVTLDVGGDMPYMNYIVVGSGSGSYDVSGSSGGGGSSTPLVKISSTAVVIPEPSSIGLTALGGLCLLARCRRNAKRVS